MTATTANRPTVGTFLTLPARKTQYNAVPGCSTPPGFDSIDGMLWAKEETLEVLTVRKSGAGFKLGVVNQYGSGFGLRVVAGWEVTFSARVA